MSGEGAHGGVGQRSRDHREDKEQENGDAIEREGDGAAPEGRELDAVELEEPRGFVCREVSHAESVTAVLLFWAWK